MQDTIELNLSFYQDASLVKSSFRHPLLSHELLAVRGRDAGAFRSCGSFEWSKAVRGLCMLLVNSKLRDLSETPDISGFQNSLAAALDYAIDKQPEWMHSMFGSDSEGNTLLKRLIRRSNSGRKRAGPVSLSVDENFIPIECIRVSMDGVDIEERHQLKSLSVGIEGNSSFLLETGYQPVENQAIL